LTRPDEVTAAVDSWREECDNIGQFLYERCELDERFSAGAARLYAAYKGWCESRREEPLTSTAFGNQLTQRFVKSHTNRGTVYQGVRVSEPQETTRSDG
jgi:putative DNA primase/helicase